MNRCNDLYLLIEQEIGDTVSGHKFTSDIIGVVRKIKTTDQRCVKVQFSNVVAQGVEIRIGDQRRRYLVKMQFTIAELIWGFGAPLATEPYDDIQGEAHNAEIIERLICQLEDNLREQILVKRTPIT